DGIDYTSLEKLLDFQISENVNAIVVLGTTGESATVTDAERTEIIRFCRAKIPRRVPLIVGTGSNDTKKAVKMTREACSLGADAVLCVTPYYVRPDADGIIDYYDKISRESDKPVIVYNVPSRTGTDIDLDTYVRLAKMKNISAIKEAGTDINKISRLCAALGDGVDLYSGNDTMTLPLLSLGAKGVISVASNVYPEKVIDICKYFESGEIEKSRAAQFDTQKISDFLFCRSNPIPIKALASKLGLCKNVLRSPLTPLDSDKLPKMQEILSKYGGAI
ncbi:MAG: 4-hydroxy-tetrahydrodipicolinate synthase, partial [Clostridiales bacterium]|nr:4-hydroxy-tetrahydrodipicolinate synthase [Clostridiales bacterium]